MDSAKKDQSTETDMNKFLWCPYETCFMSIYCTRHGICGAYQEWLFRRKSGEGELKDKND